MLLIRSAIALIDLELVLSPDTRVLPHCTVVRIPKGYSGDPLRARRNCFHDRNAWQSGHTTGWRHLSAQFHMVYSSSHGRSRSFSTRRCNKNANCDPASRLEPCKLEGEGPGFYPAASHVVLNLGVI